MYKMSRLSFQNVSSNRNITSVILYSCLQLNMYKNGYDMSFLLFECLSICFNSGEKIKVFDEIWYLGGL